MSTDYPPGTVAIVGDPVEGERTAIFIGGGDQPCWHTTDAEGHLRCLAADAAESVRPLVVIDPEDREQTARLADAFCLARWSHIAGSNECDPLTRGAMREALAAYLAPPKPAEPTGLGAVVEDVDGVLWTRFTREYDYDAVWSHETSHRGNARYADIAAVRILSEGVQA